MRHRLSRISNLLDRVEAAMSKASMREDVQRFYDTGERPTSEPAASFVVLLEAFGRMADASIGGDYEQACKDYEQACQRWDRAEQGVKWVA